MISETQSTIDKIKALLPQNPSTIHHDIEYVNLVNKLNEIINGNSTNNENMPGKKSRQGRPTALLDAFSA